MPNIRHIPWGDKMGKNCCFTGHRPEKLGISQERVEAALKREIHRAVGEGYTTFLTGMSRGVDLWAARLVLEERRVAPEIRLVCAVPYRGFSDRWSAPWRRLYREVLEQAAEARVFFPSFSYRAFAVRNRWMVDRADRVIAVYTGCSGGTEQTLCYARRRGVEVVLLGNSNT